MRIDRDPGRAVRHLEWRVRLLAIGAVLALAGMWIDNAWMLNVAIVVLAVGFALRFVPVPAGGSEDEDEDEAGAEDGDEPELRPG